MDFSTIGILRGMGPEATLECFESIIDHTTANKDQKHLPVVVINRPQIPDRTKAILDDGEDTVPCLRNSARSSERAGADFIIIPCNTAHYFLDDVREAINIPILNMVKLAVDSLTPGSTTGLLPTDGTIRTSLYEDYAN